MVSPRRILLINHNVAWSGGTFYRAWHIGRHLAARGHHVTLLTIGPRERWQFNSRIQDAVEIVESPDLLPGSARSGWDPWDTVRRRGFVRAANWDLVHAFDSRPAVILPALAARARGAALVMDWADWWGRGGTIDERAAGARLRPIIRPVETFFEEHYRTRADATTVISRALEQRAVDLGVPAETILRLPQGCDVEGIVPAERAHCRALLGIGDGFLLFGYLGVLTQSDAALLWDTIRGIRTRRPDARVVLIGNSRVTPPGDLDVIATGFVEKRQDVVTWLGACDVLLLPLRETLASRARWPSKANDYLAAARPVACTRVGDLAPLIEETGAGCVTDPTAGALAAAAVALAADPAWLERCRAARGLAEGPLAWSALVDRLETHYVSAIQRRRDDRRTA